MSLTAIKVNNTEVLHVDEELLNSNNLVKNKAVYKELITSAEEIVIHNRNTVSCTGIFSDGCCYVLEEPIPAGYSITALEVQKANTNQNDRTNVFVLVDVNTNEIKQTFPCTFDSLNERDLYSQSIPETYNETDCYFGILIKTGDNAYVGSSYPNVYLGHHFCYDYDESDQLLTNKRNLNYDIGIYLKICNEISRFDNIDILISNINLDILDINNELYIEYEESVIGSINLYSGTTSAKFAYCPKDAIVPPNTRINYIKVSKSSNSVQSVENCYLGLINIETDSVEKKFLIDNFSTPEADGTYKQIPPDDFYSPNNCYLASLVYSTSKYVAASSWPAQVPNACYCWDLSDSDVLTNKHIMDYGMDIEAHFGSLSVSVKTVVEEMMGGTLGDIQDLLNHNDKVVLAPKDYYISSPITLTSGKSLYGSFGKTRLLLTNGCTTAINITNAEKVIIDGITIVGTLPNYNYQMNGIVPNDGVYYTITSPDEIYCTYPGSSKGGSVRSTQHITGMGTETGIYAYYSEYVILLNIAFNNIDGPALRMNHVGKDYIKCANINNLFINNCFNGIWCENEHEFSMYNNVKISLCQVGMLIASGNLIFNNFAVTRCRIGVALSDGYNHGHGIINNFEIKHCQVYGLCIQDVNYGMVFGELFMLYANMYIKDSIGICINKLTHTNFTLTCVNSVGYTKNNSILTACGTSFTPSGNLVVKQFVDWT